jgi:hypothetical protein
MTSTDRCVALDFSRAEAWVVHAALLDRIERETDIGNDIDREMSLLRNIERDDYAFADTDLAVLRTALSTYLADAPARDRSHGQAILDKIDGVVA